MCCRQRSRRHFKVSDGLFESVNTLSRCQMSGDVSQMQRHSMKPGGSHRSKRGVLSPSRGDQSEVAGRRGRSCPAHSQRQVAKAIGKSKACMACEQGSRKPSIAQGVSFTSCHGYFELMPCTQFCAECACCHTMQVPKQIKCACQTTSGRSDCHPKQEIPGKRRSEIVQARPLCSVQM